MKKFTAILTAAFMMLSLTACGGDTNSSGSSSDASGASNSSDASQSESGSGTSSDMDSSQSETDNSGSDSGSDQSGSDSSATSSQPGEGAEITDAAALLNNVFGLFGEEEQFAAMGGDYENPVDGQAGAFDISDSEAFDSMAGFPAAEIGKIDSAATLVHMMNANTFTGAAVHLAEGSDAAEVAEAIKTHILNRQWMCGFPERLIVASAEDYLVFAFGHNDLISAFTEHLAEAYPDAETLCDEPIE